jgi:hypothetical protein
VNWVPLSCWSDRASAETKSLRAESTKACLISSGSGSITWAAVTMYPSGVITHPVPKPDTVAVVLRIVEAGLK